MGLDLESQTNTQNTQKSKHALIYGLLGGIVLIMVIWLGINQSKIAKDKGLPDGVVQVKNLPFALPSYIKGEIGDKYKVGSLYVVAVTTDGQTTYHSLTDNGKFITATYILDDKGKLIMDSTGFVDDTADTPINTQSTQSQTQTDEVQETKAIETETGLKPISFYENGMPKSFFTDNLVIRGQHSFTPKVNTRTPAIAPLSTDLDLFARHVIDSVYSSMTHSDTLTKEFKDNPQGAVYVMYDPNCPHCRIEVPQLLNLKQQGYPFIFVPIPALSQAPNPATDDDFHYQLLAPSLGKQALQDTLVKKSDYKRPSGYTMPDSDRQKSLQNRNIFMDLPALLNEYYTQKYGADMTAIYGDNVPLAVPTVLYVDKQTGDVKYRNLTDDLIGVSITR